MIEYQIDQILQHKIPLTIFIFYWIRASQRMCSNPNMTEIGREAIGILNAIPDALVPSTSLKETMCKMERSREWQEFGCLNSDIVFSTNDDDKDYKTLDEISSTLGMILKHSQKQTVFHGLEVFNIYLEYLNYCIIVGSSNPIFSGEVKDLRLLYCTLFDGYIVICKMMKLCCKNL